jgi:hypothetical protein
MANAYGIGQCGNCVKNREAKKHATLKAEYSPIKVSKRVVDSGVLRMMSA